MRRGHPGHIGLGGWRNENPRHFRPRSGGNQHFRPSRGYGMLDPPRFPPPSSRANRNSLSFKQRSDSNEHTRHENHDRGKYRSDFRSNNYQRNHESVHQPLEKQMYPMKHHMRPQDSAFGTSYPKPSNFYEGSSKHYHMNNMGDIDDRYIPPREQFRQYPISPWATDPIVNQFEDRHKYEHKKSHRHEAGESSKLPLYDYTGHRPPSSDHYHSNPTPVINNSESFNRSVDDTVNIIRKRLLNRNDPSSEQNDSNYSIDDQVVKKTEERTQNFQNEQSVKKKVIRPRQSEKSGSGASFTKIKSKIVNQLFKMDKEKIHKLMDNPTSSSKFEYAISSLITESQYSFNRHLRSVAEKSLHTSSSIDFIQDDNNTIYEDTFMKQMQCILDPQDTVLLEDIKPIVMAELSKALQLDEYEHEHRYEGSNDEINYQQKHEQPNLSTLTYNSEYYDNLYNYEEYPHQSNMSNEQTFEQKYIPSEMDVRPRKNIQDNGREGECSNYGSHDNNNESKYERRSRSRSKNLSPERLESLHSPPKHPRKSLDERLSELRIPGLNVNPEPVNSPFHSNTEDDQLFKSNSEPTLEDEDDPFAELDKQYHVAVDPSFIDNDDCSSVHLDSDSQPTNTPNSKTNVIQSLHPSRTKIEINLNASEKELYIIKEEIENQLQDIALTSIDFPSYSNIKTEPMVAIKSERKMSIDNQTSAYTNIIKTEKTTSTILNENTDLNKLNKEVDRSDASHMANKSSTLLPSRKRSIEQSPSHRKEKRKKSVTDSGYQESEKNIQNKNTITFDQDTSSKSSKKDDKKAFTDKHTKRKESHKKGSEKDYDRKKPNSIDSLDSSFSPKETVNTVTTSNNKLQNKPESKTTFKTFDLFTEQPKKVSLHQSHRNTALPVVDTTLKSSISPPKSKHLSKITKRHMSVQTVKKVLCKEIQTIESKCTSTRFTQTDKRRSIAKGIQTDPVQIDLKKHSNRSTDPLERMKEIDMEIQELLQEKFKLYSSIESKESGTNSLHGLGMAVVNVSPSEDTIVDDFTNIPAEELEQIALESVEEKEIDSLRPETRNRRVRTLSKEKSKSQSPTPSSQKRNNKKAKTPNISLIEQIIIEDRPIEDLISLDDLEVTPKSRPKSSKTKRKSKRKAPIKSQVSTTTSEILSGSDYNLKDCTVLLVREDFSRYLSKTEDVKIDDPPVHNELVFEPQNDLLEEDHVNDIQFDMLDVSEDIVIGDICEVKSIEDKEESVIADIPISEEIILDNSQSSLEDTPCLNSDPKENECKMFDYSADENLRQDSISVTGHADAVLAVECIENNFIAACLDGNVYYFSGDGQLITTLRGSNLAVTCLTIVKEKYGTTVYTGSLDSRIRYYDLDTGLEKGPECNVLSPIQTMDRAWDTVFVGTRTGFVLQFECKNNMLIPVSTVQFSDQAILALRAMKEGPRKVLLVASRSEDVTIKDAQTGLLLRTLVGPKMTVYTLLYEDGKVYCGTSGSQIHVFDYSSGTHVGAHEGGKGAVCLRAAGGLVFAGCYDGCVYVFREGERRPFAQLRGPGLMLLSLAVVGTKIIAGYKDRNLYIWKIPLSILQEMIL